VHGDPDEALRAADEAMYRDKAAWIDAIAAMNARRRRIAIPPKWVYKSAGRGPCAPLRRAGRPIGVIAMNANKPYLLSSRGALVCALTLTLVGAGAPAQAKKLVASNTDDQSIVECQLPPQIRTLGNHATYLAAGRRISTTVADCKVRGGKYNGHGPGALANQATDGAASMAVTIGGDQARPACPKSGVVAGLKNGGALSVRAAPGATAGRIDKLGGGKHVFMCDWSGDGAWVGVVYAGSPSVDCGVSKTIDRPQPYDGACHSGWVSAKYLKPLAR
jgi:hypothetical protein